MHQISIDKFEGPLDLLLQLIEKSKLSITEISLARVTDQYLTYLEKCETLPADEVADFLLIASKLIYLKSRYLLPDLDLADEEDAHSLERQLKIYRQYYEASKAINRFYSSRRRYAFARQLPYRRQLTKEFLPPKNVSANILNELFKEVLMRIERVINLPKVVMARAISIGEKIKHIRDFVKTKKFFNFNHLIKDKNNRVEVVVNFLAMLELIKQKEIVVEQVEMFGDLNIKKIE